MHAALIREAREETGITIAAEDISFAQVMHNAYGLGRMAFFFEVRSWTGQVTNRERARCHRPRTDDQ